MSTPVNSGATLVAPVHQIDPAALAAYLRENVAGCDAEITVAQFQGGQSNPTYRVTTRERQFVLRRKPPGKLLPSAHAIEREYRVMAALANSPVPVPRMFAYCADEAVIGSAFFLMEYIEGRILWDPTLPGMTGDQRNAHYDELNRVIAALHAVDFSGTGLADFGKPGRYVERQIARWSRQYHDAGVEPIPALDHLIEWLQQHLPSDDETSVVHGDYRIDNVIFHPTEPRIMAVLDWELSTLGHPVSDFAYQVMAWRLSPSDFRGLKGFDLDTLGIPSESAYVAAYCRRTGRVAIANWEYYLIFNMFRIAAILHGVLARSLQGNNASANACEQGQRARQVADVAWRTAQNL